MHGPAVVVVVVVVVVGLCVNKKECLHWCMHSSHDGSSIYRKPTRFLTTIAGYRQRSNNLDTTKRISPSLVFALCGWPRDRKPFVKNSSGLWWILWIEESYQNPFHNRQQARRRLCAWALWQGYLESAPACDMAMVEGCWIPYIFNAYYIVFLLSTFIHVLTIHDRFHHNIFSTASFAIGSTSFYLHHASKVLL